MLLGVLIGAAAPPIGGLIEFAGAAYGTAGVSVEPYGAAGVSVVLYGSVVGAKFAWVP